MPERITGGEPVKKIIQLTEADMRDVQALRKAGFGQGDPRAPAPAGGYDAIIGLRRRGRSKGEAYAAWIQSTRDLMVSTDPRISAAHKRASQGFKKGCKAALSAGDLHNNSTIANMSLQYANDEYIGEQLMPAVLTAKKSDTYFTYGKADRMQTVVDDVIADDGETPDVSESRSTASYATQDRGNKNHISANAIANQDAPLNELFDLSEGVTELRHLAREQRIRTVLTTAGNYPTANKETLSGADQWNASEGGNPIKKFQDGIAALYRGIAPAKTKFFSGLDIFHVLSRHADIVGLFLYNGSSPGLATPDMIARLVGADEYLVGSAREVTSVEGDTDAYGRIWGDYFGILRVANHQTVRSATFGMTMRWTMPGVPGANQGILTQQWFDATKGLGGTYFTKVGESEAHIIQASDTGFLYSDCLA